MKIPFLVLLLEALMLTGFSLVFLVL